MLELAKLISKNYTVNELQERIAVETEYEVWIDMKSISRAEFSAAGSNGLTPEMVVRTNAINYNGEDEIEINQKRYGIYRTYRIENSDDIELYLQRKTGYEV